MEYYNLPKEFQTIHSACYKIVQQIDELIICDDYKFLQTSEFPLTKEEYEKYNESVNIWAYLKENNEEKFYKCLNKRLMLGLLGDFCYFTQESLRCSNKMRVVVAYALLRRPIVDNLKILLRIFFCDDFYDDFINKNEYDLANLRGEELKNLLKRANKIRFNDTFLIIPEDYMFHWIYDRTNTYSINNLSDKALHPATTRYWNKMDKMSFNFMFSNTCDVYSLLKNYYSKLPTILIFIWDLFNTLIFSLFDDEIDMKLHTKRYNKLLETVKPIYTI